jgi:hypothetical protein
MLQAHCRAIAKSVPDVKWKLSWHPPFTFCRFSGCCWHYTVIKAFRHFRPQPGCYLPNSPWAGFMMSYMNYSWPRRVWYVTSRLGTGISKSFFCAVPAVDKLKLSEWRPFKSCRFIGYCWHNRLQIWNRDSLDTLPLNVADSVPGAGRTGFGCELETLLTPSL